MKEKIKAEIKSQMKNLENISQYLYENPELGHKEFKACALLANFLTENGFTTQQGICGLPTAFRADFISGRPGPTVAYLCEYDALPGIGHGCGHNLIAAMGVGGALGLKSVIDEVGGNIVVFGTPAEETDGAKVTLSEKGAFKGVTAAMMVHPSGVSKESGSSLALNALQFEFFGKTAHASGCPEKGINALDAVLATFNNINALRQYIGSTARIHGIISEGGKAPNVVPDYAVCKFYVRSAAKKHLQEISEKVINCAKAAGLSTGAELKVSNFEFSNDDLRTNSVLSEAFNNNLRQLGETEIEKAEAPSGSSDMGNVSYIVPSIHPYIGMKNKALAGHTVEFAACTQSKEGKEALFNGACALAFTGFDIISSKDLTGKILEEFKNI